jgi:DNA helicase-2/ATP-dependent DNA helicase PcrA
LEDEARQRNLSLWDTIQLAIEQRTFSARTLNALKEFHSLISKCLEEAGGTPLPELLRFIIERSGYKESLQNENTEESQSRLENLEELVNAAQESQERGETMRDFIDHAALVSDTDDYDEKAPVTLMTLHSAKGLEFSTVFLVGLEEGLFPHIRSMSNEAEIEEERRLCYVGMTRAEKKLYLTRARCRRFFGNENLTNTQVSRFIPEIPNALTEIQFNGQLSGHTRSSPVTAYNTVESIQEFYRQRGKQIDLAPPNKTIRTAAKSIQYGSYVRHPKFGVGAVIRCEGEGGEAKLTVSFPRHGIKKIIQKFATLEEN